MHCIKTGFFLKVADRYFRADMYQVGTFLQFRGTIIPENKIPDNIDTMMDLIVESGSMTSDTYFTIIPDHGTHMSITQKFLDDLIRINPGFSIDHLSYLIEVHE